MTTYVLTPEEIAWLRQRKISDSNRHIAWRGHDDLYVSKLRELYGFPSDLQEIAVAPFPEGPIVVTLNGPSGGLLLMFRWGPRDATTTVDSLYIGRPPESLILDVDAQPVIDATADMLLRQVPPTGGVQ
jgi:hypothetical protein